MIIGLPSSSSSIRRNVSRPSPSGHCTQSVTLITRTGLQYASSYLRFVPQLRDRALSQGPTRVIVDSHRHRNSVPMSRYRCRPGPSRWHLTVVGLMSFRIFGSTCHRKTHCHQRHNGICCAPSTLCQTPELETGSHWFYQCLDIMGSTTISPLSIQLVSSCRHFFHLGSNWQSPALKHPVLSQRSC